MESFRRLPELPDEIWIHILEYLDPSDLLPVQHVSTRLFKLGRDSSLWRAKCFEQAPSAVHALSGRTSALEDLLNSLSLNEPSSNASTEDAIDGRRKVSRRAKAIADWDCTTKEERIDWYTEHIARHAPLSTEWLHHAQGNEIRSMALFDGESRVLSAMEDGSIRIWDVRTATNGRRSLQESARSTDSILFADLSTASGPSQPRVQAAVGTAVDSSVVDSSRMKAYIAVNETLNEVDLNTMQLVSQEKFAWKITAISQQAGEDVPLMVGTSFSLNMHDPRIALKHQVDCQDEKVETVTTAEDDKIVFLPNYGKDKRFISPNRPSRRQTSYGRRPRDLTSWAPVEPGPQAILDRGPNEIIIAGRMPSILFYDKRTFPDPLYSVHSGARLSALALHPTAPRDSKTGTAQATLIACGEYQGRGSLEIYELPYRNPSSSYLFSNNEAGAEVPRSPFSAGPNRVYLPELTEANSEDSDTDSPGPATSTSAGTPYSYKNRQSSSSAKLLSVATQGARIVFSDGDGSLKWMERDGKGLARRWNINTYAYSHTGGALVGDAVARKICTFAKDNEWQDGKMQGMTRGDGDLLIWTGSELGIVTSRVKWEGHDDLVKDFEEKLTLDDSGERRSDRPTDIRDSSREEEYSRVMRRALERQADERRWMSRFGMRPR
ncbi:hypothetical protein H2198_001684 [Neophaeococcomyces mojaviensis]|uniref:Uncharacterized protein n=1 Tax=Neophaeococcomyces mojaviensis TaxID=3383035 RepID=A0ACC3AGB6_9EURO|nr:hypothetical protein H2198_001684 [Knufia sp. JES_112]